MPTTVTVVARLQFVNCSEQEAIDAANEILRPQLQEHAPAEINSALKNYSLDTE